VFFIVRQKDVTICGILYHLSNSGWRGGGSGASQRFHRGEDEPEENVSTISSRRREVRRKRLNDLVEAKEKLEGSWIENKIGSVSTILWG